VKYVEPFLCESVLKKLPSVQKTTSKKTIIKNSTKVENLLLYVLFLIHGWYQPMLLI